MNSTDSIVVATFHVKHFIDPYIGIFCILLLMKELVFHILYKFVDIRLECK